VILWRISNYADLTGIGGLKASARWHEKPRPVVYLAQNAEGALLEHLVHLPPGITATPDPVQLLKVEVPDQISVVDAEPYLPTFWQDDDAITRNVGSSWLDSQSSALMRVPSAVFPPARNYLLNPLHPDAKLCIITSVWTHPFDGRLVKR
jgi:RES domain-containing protein